MNFLVSTFVLVAFLKASFGLLDDTHRNQVLNEAPNVKIQSQEYFQQQRPTMPHFVTQPYVPVPVHLIQRSVFSQQPQAALIVIKAYPIQLSPAQSASLHYGNVQNVVQNVLPYNPAPRRPIYASTQPTQARSIVVPAHHHQINSINYAPNPNTNLYYAPTSNTKQGDSYLSQLAQVVAQQYSKTSSYKTPAIITGLENFSSDQQDQIKSYLKNYISTHSQEFPQLNAAPEHREIVNTAAAADGKYSSKPSTDSYSQQTEWMPSHQKADTSEKSSNDKS